MRRALAALALAAAAVSSPGLAEEPADAAEADAVQAGHAPVVAHALRPLALARGLRADCMPDPGAGLVDLPAGTALLVSGLAACRSGEGVRNFYEVSFGGMPHFARFQDVHLDDEQRERLLAMTPAQLEAHAEQMHWLSLSQTPLSFAPHSMPFAPREAVVESPPQPEFDPREFGRVSGRSTTQATVSQQLTPHCSLTREGRHRRLAPGSVQLVTGVYVCTGHGGRQFKFYELMIEGETYLAEPSQVRVEPADEERLLRLAPAHRARYVEFTRRLSLDVAPKTRREAMKALEATAPHGLAIVRSKVFDTSESTPGKSFRVVLFNPTDQVIESVWLTVVGHGPARRAAEITLKMKGPIKRYETADYSWRDLWRTNQVEAHQITRAQVQYTNGSRRVIDNIEAIHLGPEYYRAIFEGDN